MMLSCTVAWVAWLPCLYIPCFQMNNTWVNSKAVNCQPIQLGGTDSSQVREGCILAFCVLGAFYFRLQTNLLWKVVSLSSSGWSPSDIRFGCKLIVFLGPVPDFKQLLDGMRRFLSEAKENSAFRHSLTRSPLHFVIGYPVLSLASLAQHRA